MMMRDDAQFIIDAAIRAALPDSAVKRALAGFMQPKGRLILVSVGKAAWQMAKAAMEVLGNVFQQGIIITKYKHSCGPLGNFEIFEAGHPIPDDNSFSATCCAINLVSGLCAEDTVLFLLSGGGSALFEHPKVTREELQDITAQLLAKGADITEINTIRKRCSNVKGGRFAQLCAPAQVFAVVLSDIIGDPLDMIASGPTCADSSTCAQANEIINKYALTLSESAMNCLMEETPKTVTNAKTLVTGGVRQLCDAAEKACWDLGYKPMILTDRLCCTARDAGSFLASIAASHQDTEASLAFIAGGETVVHVTGSGLGGRNQELALAAAEGISGLHDTAVFSIGSDGTDGPTDAAGGYCDQNTRNDLLEKGISIPQVLQKSDAYHALKDCGGLIITGPTGTNVNDLSVVLIRRK